jgi:predicted O-methyltransferase YrrM
MNGLIRRLRAAIFDPWRIGLLIMSRAAASVAELLRQESIKIDIHREGLTKLSIRPVRDVPALQVDLASSNPIATILASQEFKTATDFFAENPVASRSLISPQAQALLYCLLRNLKPQHVFEIGTYRAGTTEAICRALHANGRGLAHTVDPFCSEQIAAVFKNWPPELLRHVQLHPMNSMAFFEQMERQAIHPGLVFVDGNHDYEFALFDIGCGARAIVPGGFIFVDNIAQVGPFFAGRDFLSANPGWCELGTSIRDYNPDRAHDRDRTTIHNTDFMVLRAPSTYRVDNRPRNFGLIYWWRNSVDGIRLKVQPPDRPTTLGVQVVFRGFGIRLVEAVTETTVVITPGADALTVAFTPPPRLTGGFAYFTIEPSLNWHGAEPLQLIQPPEPY